MPTTAEITQRYVQAHDDIANAITNKGGTVNTGDGFEDFATDIGSIPTANIQPVTILSNGVYTVSGDVDGYSPVTVNVPNTYTALDEGCVVDNGILVPQSSTSITTNGTHNTTLNNSVIVNVPNSYSASDEGKVVSNGALVPQTSTTITTNNTTVDTTLINSVSVAVPGSTIVADVFSLNVGAGPAHYGASSSAYLVVYKFSASGSVYSYVVGSIHTATKAANCIMSINLTGFNGTHLSDWYSGTLTKVTWLYLSTTKVLSLNYKITISNGNVAESAQVSSSYYDKTLNIFCQ